MEKSPPAELKQAEVADRSRLLAELVEKKVFNDLRASVGQFVVLYGGPPGQDFQATLNQALFVANAAPFQTLVQPAGSNLTARLNKTKLPEEVADEMYLATLTRFPSKEEQAEVAAYLKDRTGDRAVAIAEMIWALLASNEFRFNH